jgi:inner membrane protein YidH
VTEPGERGPHEGPLDPRDYSRRTLLANERTYLAWWRTGLTTLTVALAAARVVPEISDSTVQWPYTVVGVVFALLGVICIGYGERRRSSVARAVRQGEFVDADPRLMLGLTVVGVLLGLGLLVLIVVAP